MNYEDKLLLEQELTKELKAKIADLEKELRERKQIHDGEQREDRAKIAELEARINSQSVMLSEKHEIISSMHKSFMENNALHWKTRCSVADELEAILKKHLHIGLEPRERIDKIAQRLRRQE